MNIPASIQRALRRTAAAAGAFVMGAIFGVLGTIAHQATIAVFGVDLPWAFIVATVAVLSLLIGLRLLLPDRAIVLGAALGVLLMIGLLSLKSAGGSVLVPNNVLGVAWSVTPTILAMLVVVWPRLPTRRMKPDSSEDDSRDSGS